MARYGWRAYAIPVLSILTILALTTTYGHRSPAPTPVAGAPAVSPSGPAGQTGPPTASSDARLKIDDPGRNAQNEALASDALPAGGQYTERGAGTFRILPGQTGPIGRGAVHHYTVEVENGVSGVDVDGFAAQVTSVLDDSRSWTGPGGVSLQRVDSGRPDFRIVLTSSLTVRQMCGYELHIETSCWSPSASTVVLNVARWVRGDTAYVGDIASYHVYMINHETGHALGHSHAHQCLPDGSAPVMMQQTISLKAADGRLCEANPWPFPPGVSGAPGPEIAGS